MGYASETYTNLIRDQYNDWLTRFYPKQKELMELATRGELMNQQLIRVSDSSANSLRAAQQGTINQLARYGTTLITDPNDNSLALRSALTTAGAKNGIREAEQDRQRHILTGGRASLRQQMNIGGGTL
ncbi:hypothetical protein AXW37_06460 [Yersinia ruckeri]|uniref:hypothetical protein n=1 Tax=Yersinia ruckeri TaxID=29486 RepID=UPI0004E46D67|nr:hypothetical protein [Yersinia ruckeri]ARZ00548.1 hypothetical protein QMA0440_01204 [Yersinia ruckeri]EKN4689902.1 hypothetical protein [Yersinia ruckeri]KFE37389.1 hypothetical protein nADLYRO1b_3252 [Yersinia ruckeri]MCK8583810.1 hypothetical protein [Yersinia ruckeri]MCW6524300.1 hypothetical protein [Yersinia ruckeri]